MNKKKIIFILGLAGFVVMADNWVVSPILPSISKDLGGSIANTSLIITAYMIPFALFQLLFGYFADRFGKRQIISLGMVFFSIATGLCAIGQSLTDLIIFRALTGIFAASVLPVSLALIGDIFPKEERQKAIGSFLGFAFLGQGLSMVIGGSIAYFFTWRNVFLVYALISITATILLFTIGKNMPSTKNVGKNVFTSYINLMKKPSNLQIYLFVLFEGILFLGSFSFLGGFIRKQFNYNNFIIGLVMTVFGVMAIVGGRTASKIAKKFGEINTIIFGFILGIMANLIFITMGNIQLSVVTGIGLLGLAVMLTHSTFLTLATEFDPKARGIAISLVAFFFNCGGGSGTAIGGRILSMSSYEMLFLIYAIGIILMTLIAFITFKKQTRDNSNIIPVENENK
jgi:predicted MFS family arabinose efflux permease